MRSLNRWVIALMAGLACSFGAVACTDHAVFDTTTRQLLEAAMSHDSVFVNAVSHTSDLWTELDEIREADPALLAAFNEGLRRDWGRVQGDQATYFYSAEGREGFELSVTFVKNGNEWAAASVQVTHTQ